MLSLLKDVLKQFIRPTAFAGNKLATDVDFKSTYNVKPESEILIGDAARSYIAEKKLAKDKVSAFFKQVVAFYTHLADYLKKNLPFDDEMLVDLSITDPQQLSMSNLQPKLRRLADWFPVLLQGASKDTISAGLAELQMATLPDKVWAELAKDAEVSATCKFFLGLLTIPHGSAHCERVFSCVRKNKTDFRPNLGIPTLESLMILKHMAGGHLGREYSAQELSHLKGACRRALH